MFKKLLTLCLICALLCVCGCASAQEEAAFTVNKIETFMEEMRALALSETDARVQTDESTGVTSVFFSGGVLELAGDALTEDTALVKLTLQPGTEDFMGLAASSLWEEEQTGSTLQDLLSAYGCVNPDLRGTYEQAVALLDGSLPGDACVGIVFRDGQTVQSATFTAYSMKNNVCVAAQADYTFYENRLVEISVTNTQEAPDALQKIEEAAFLQEENEYFLYPQSENGADLEPFAREDMLFAGIDFLSAQVTDFTDLMGTPLSSNEITDSDGTKLLSASWEGVDAAFRYDAKGNYLYLAALYVTTDRYEGPRAVRVGDSARSVIKRFRYGEEEAADGTVLLYGDGETPPYGVMKTENTGASITYAAPTPDGTVALYLDCEGLRLSEFSLVRLENAEE